MSYFKWDEVDVMTVLEVEPEVEEDGISHLYIVEKDGLRLEICIFSYIGDISILLYREGAAEPFVRLPLAQCTEARRVFYKTGEYLEIIQAQTVANSEFDRPYIGFDVRVWIKPTIKIELI